MRDRVSKRILQKIQDAKERQLKELDLSYEMYDLYDYSEDILIEILEWIFRLVQLEKLNLHYNPISHLPESLGNLTSLNTLNLSGNKLASLPESLGNLTSLNTLKLSGNELTSLPESLGNLTNLNTLNLSGNELTSLPESLGNLTNLNVLDLSENQLTSLPDSLGDLTNLNKLFLYRNKLASIPKSLGDLTNLNKLSLHGNKLTSLPESLGDLTNLNTLSLSNNELTIFPEFLDNIISLNNIFLYKNKLTSLPESLGNLTNLNMLQLSNNELTSLPESLGNLTNLKVLDLSENQLTSLPDSLGNLTNLNKLRLSNNKLISLPDSLGNLTNLNKLHLSNNKLTSLPDSLGNLTNLNALYLEINKLISLPESLGKLTRLNNLYLIGNSLEEPPLEIAQKGLKAIKKYFEQLKKEGQNYIYEAKLLIVGEGGSGKTTLAKKILDPNYELQEHQQSTEGIDVMKWRFKCLDNEQKERYFTVNIWDFGGQEIYHATHQFFLSKRSLYSLVVDSRKEHTDFYYWLNIVELLSDNSSLIIIRNEIQDRPVKINERSFRGRFTNLEKTLATNLATNRGLDEIIKNIKYYIQNLPLVGQALPKTWIKVREALEKDDRNYISLQEYLDICKDNGFNKLSDKLQLSGYLHDLGVCLHFQDQENSLLYKTMILKPTWGTDAVYKVLDNKKVVNNQGYFTWDDLKTIWQDKQYFAMRGELLELMKKFKLCYEISEEKNSFIAPQLLSNNQPEYNWNDNNNLILRYAYPKFMPKGIVTRFIVIMHRYIENQEYVWKSGVILSKDKTKAEVIENYGEREIKIRVVGNNKRNFLTIVSNEIDKINESYEKLNYQKLIPCNCEVCKNIQNPFAYDFDKIIERAGNNKLTIECSNHPYHEVQVLELIDNAIDVEQLIDKDELINFDKYQTMLEEKDKEIDRLYQFIKQKSEQAKVVQNFHEKVNLVTGNVENAQNINRDTYNQSGNFGIAHNEGNISDDAEISGVTNEATPQKENKSFIAVVLGLVTSAIAIILIL